MKTCDDKKKGKDSGGATYYLSATVFKGGLVPARVVAQCKGKPMLSSYRRQSKH